MMNAPDPWIERAKAYIPVLKTLLKKPKNLEPQLAIGPWAREKLRRRKSIRSGEAQPFQWLSRV